MLPPGNPCPWVGVGYVGCDGSFRCTSWVISDIFMGYKRGDPPNTQAAFHELGHNSFLSHAASYRDAAGAIDEYGDSTCGMGSW